MTVLIADDDLLARMILERRVVQWGYHFVSARDGETAKGLLQSRKIDVCILDWEMPGMTGVELCKTLKSECKNKAPYVILHSIRDYSCDIRAAYAAGADEYLVKPSNMRHLRQLLAEVAEKAAKNSAANRIASNLSPVSICDLAADLGLA